MTTETLRGEYRISTDPGQADIDAIHAYLKRSYWADSIPKEIVARSIVGSVCFSLFHGNEQVGFARVVTDRATFGYLCDVYVLEEHRGRGLARWLMEAVQSHPDLQGLRRWMLVTRDAHGVYAPFGFQPLKDPSGHMEIARPGIYRAGGGA